MKLKLVEDYDKKLKKGSALEVDKIMRTPACGSGFMFRVIGTWSDPTWLDAGWFLVKPKNGCASIVDVL